MNTRYATSTLALLVPVALAGMLLGATASAAPITDPNAIVQSVVGGEGHVWVTVDDEGVATLTGYVDSASVRRQVERAVLDREDVERVVDLITDN